MNKTVTALETRLADEMSKELREDSKQPSEGREEAGPGRGGCCRGESSARGAGQGHPGWAWAAAGFIQRPRGRTEPGDGEATTTLPDLNISQRSTEQPDRKLGRMRKNSTPSTNRFSETFLEHSTQQQNTRYSQGPTEHIPR